ncbi:hypothetical protein D3C81_1049150 [compost metagenome]
MAGDENNRNRRVGRRQLALEVQAAATLQPYIKDQTAGAICLGVRKKLRGGRKGRHLYPGGAQKATQCVANGGIVIHHEHHGTFTARLTGGGIAVHARPHLGNG